jgi:NitT/TauT family transport system permease protein
LKLALDKILPPITCAIAILIIWHFAIVIFGFEAFILPHPKAVILIFIEKFNELLKASFITASAALMGLLLSLLLGYCIALIFSLSNWLERGLYPLALFFQTVPIVAVAPLVILWVGQGFYGVMTVSLILSIFPIISGATTGLTRLPKSYIELFSLYKSNTFKRMLYLQIPHSLPHVIAGLRVSSGLAVIGSIIGEFSAGYGSGNSGLGYYILASSGNLKTDLLFASIITSTIMGWLIFICVDRLGNLLLSTFHINQTKVK